MYSKIYSITSSEGTRDAMLEYYDSTVATAVKSSEHHAGHHMVETGENKYMLVSNYKSKDAAAAAAPLVQQLIGPMVEKFGVTLEPVCEGEVIRQF